MRQLKVKGTRQSRVRVGRGASTRRSVLRTDSPGFARFRGPSYNSLRAPKGAPFKQVRRVSLRSAQARAHEIEQTQAPRNDAPRPTRTRLCRDMVGAQRL